MPTYVALLRGINLAGHNRVAMADLRDVVSGLGHTDVTTFIQSGNVVFTARKKSTPALAADLERAIAAKLGVVPQVVVLSRDELAQIVADNPYKKKEPDPKRVHVIFLAENAGAGVKKSVDTAVRQAATKGGGDTARVVGRVVYLHTPDGYGRSDLGAALARADGKSLGATGTARNWSTVTKLLALCDG